MVYLLSKIFIKDRNNYQSPKVRKGYGTLSGILGIFLNILLFVGKFIAGTIAGAISITADAFNNLSDAGSSLISLIGFRLADKKPDADHPFGHGRIEYLAGLIVSFLIILMGFELGKSSFEKIMNPEQIEGSTLTIVILIVSIAVKVYMFAYNRIYGLRINSSSMKATSIDSLSDTIATTVVLVCVIVAKCTGLMLDGIGGILVSAFILFAGIKSVKETISPLLGQPPEKEFVDRIIEIAGSYEEILGIHDLVVHDYGPGRCMISLHCEVSEDGNFNVLHDIIDCCERKLEEELHCEAVIHMDPICVNDEHVNEMKNMVKKAIAEYNESLSIHDFRMVEGPTHTNVLFDIVIPMDKKINPDEIKEKAMQIVEELPGNCLGIIKIDKDYVSSH